MKRSTVVERARVRRIAHWQLWWLLAPMLLLGCEPHAELNTRFWNALDRVSFVSLPLTEAWVSPAEVSLVLERRYRSIAEQRILLPNTTSIRGENFILMIAQEGTAPGSGRFSPGLLMARNDGPPEPFVDFDGQPTASRQDTLGWLHWSQWTNGTDLTCVLAFRHLDATDRMMPGKSSSIDMMLRNCLYGSAEEALEPFVDIHTGYAAIAEHPNGNQRMLSPLAGPQP